MVDLIEELEDLQTLLENALTPEGCASDIVTMQLTKRQLATILDLVNMELRDPTQLP